MEPSNVGDETIMANPPRQNEANNPLSSFRKASPMRKKTNRNTLLGYDYYGQTTAPQNDASNPFIELKMPLHQLRKKTKRRNTLLGTSPSHPTSK